MCWCVGVLMILWFVLVCLQIYDGKSPSLKGGEGGRVEYLYRFPNDGCRQSTHNSGKTGSEKGTYYELDSQ